MSINGYVVEDHPVECPNCGWKGLEEDLRADWDWGGPVCPQCKQSGMTMLRAVVGPVRSGMGALIETIENFINKCKGK